MRRFLHFAAAFLAVCVVAAPAAAVDTGVAKGVRPAAEANGGGTVRQLVVGADVKVGETVNTGANGLVQLLFNDKTELVVGPKSSLKIEDYLIRDNGSAGKFAISALAGTFRFVTGTAPKNRYEITTPTGTIGVRGTSFDFSIVPSVPDFVPPAKLTTLVLLMHGAVRICNRAGSCVLLTEVCDFAAASSAGSETFDNTAESRRGFRPYFPLALDQSRLLGAFRVSNARQCVSPATTEAAPVPQGDSNTDTRGAPASTGTTIGDATLTRG